MADDKAITGPRVEGWQIDAVTPAGDIIATLPMVEGTGQHDWQLDRLNPLGLSCIIAERMPDGTPLPDLRGMWLRATHRINGTPYLLATVVPTGAPRALTATTSLLAIKGTDPTVLLSRAKLRKTLVLPIATPIAATVRALIAEYAPQVTAHIGDADETLRTHLAFNAGDNILTIINTLLDAAAYTALAPLPNGTLTSLPWAPPITLAPTLNFSDTDGAPFLPDLEMDDNYLNTPNEVIAIGKGGQDMPAVVGRWPDAPPTNPITEVIDVDATSIEAARMLARKHHDSLQGRARSTTTQGPWQPIQPGQVAGFVYARHGVNARFLLTGTHTVWTTRSPTDYQMQEARNG